MASTRGSSRLAERLRAARGAMEELPREATVTSVAPTRDQTGRVTIGVGRVRVGPIDALTAHELGIREGCVLDGAARGALVEAVETQLARQDAIRLIRARARSARELMDRLALKGHSRAAARNAVDRLVRAGVVDDETLASNTAQRLASRRDLSPRAAEIRLRARGIEASTARRAAEGAFQGTDLEEQALGLARKRLRTIPSGTDPRAAARRVLGYLARRGYDHETCRRAVEQAMRSATNSAGEPRR